MECSTTNFITSTSSSSSSSTNTYTSSATISTGKREITTQQILPLPKELCRLIALYDDTTRFLVEEDIRRNMYRFTTINPEIFSTVVALGMDHMIEDPTTISSRSHSVDSRIRRTYVELFGAIPNIIGNFNSSHESMSFAKDILKTAYKNIPIIFRDLIGGFNNSPRLRIDSLNISKLFFDSTPFGSGSGSVDLCLDKYLQTYSSTEFLSPQPLNTILKIVPFLHTLDVSSCQIDDLLATVIAIRLPLLTSLDISDNRNIYEIGFNALSTLCNLTQLSLRTMLYSSHINSNYGFVFALPKFSKRLHTLDLSDSSLGYLLDNPLLDEKRVLLVNSTRTLKKLYLNKGTLDITNEHTLTSTQLARWRSEIPNVEIISDYL